LEYFTAIWNILWQFCIVCGNLVNFPVLVCWDREKSGNHAGESKVDTIKRGFTGKKTGESKQISRKESAKKTLKPF
jgi:hypothetical protein